jgi:hypothetical protein
MIIPIGNWQFASGSGLDPARGIPFAGYGGSFSQILSLTPDVVQAMPDKPGYHVQGVYTLTFKVENHFASYPGYYDVELGFGTQELGECTGWGTNGPTEVSVVWPSPGYLIVDKALPSGGQVQGKQPFYLKFSTPVWSWPVLFDAVSLVFTPNP